MSKTDSQLRFYATSFDAVPVGPKTAATYRGRPRQSYDLVEASKRCGWPATALVALHHATYPPADDDADDGLDDLVSDFAEAMYDPDVRERLAFHARSLGDVPPAAFLIALLDDWDHSDPEAKTASLIGAMAADLPDSGAWQLHRQAKAKAVAP
jgi:hypothetical protein